MAQSDVHLLEDELAAILSDARSNGNVEAGLVQALTHCAFARNPDFTSLYVSGGRLPRELWG